MTMMMNSSRKYHVLLILVSIYSSQAFVSLQQQPHNKFCSDCIKKNQNRSVLFALSAEEEAEKLREKARQLREEIAAKTGQTLEELEEEAANKRKQEQELIELRKSFKKKPVNSKNRNTGGSFLQVPETFDDQIWQAKAAIERAYKDGINRQIIRLALIPEGETLNVERTWPGGAQQMYREAAGPLTRELLKQIRPNNEESGGFTKPPTVKTQDIWDFDGSALITAEAVSSPKDDVQAMVLPNTDDRYTNDIITIDKVMKERLFILVNPFWRNIDSWGINILAPKAKDNAQAAIFDNGFQETFCVLEKWVRGEHCVALKVYPYDWQLYAYAIDFPHREYLVHLGSSIDEPTSAEFATKLKERSEFTLSRNI